MKHLFQYVSILFYLLLFIQCNDDSPFDKIEPAPKNDQSGGNHYFITNPEPQDEILEKISTLSGTPIETLDGIKDLLNRLFKDVPEHMLNDGFFQLSHRFYIANFSPEKKWFDKSHTQIKSLEGDLYLSVSVDYDPNKSTDSTHTLELENDHIIIEGDTITSGNTTTITSPQEISIPLENYSYGIYIKISYSPYYGTGFGTCLKPERSCQERVKIGRQESDMPF